MFQEAGDLGADLGKFFGELGEGGGMDGRVGEEAHLPCLRQRISIAEITERHEGLVPLWGDGREVSIAACAGAYNSRHRL